VSHDRPRIGIIGLGLSNPYTFARILKAEGADVAYVWDYHRDAAEAFARENGCEAAPTWQELLKAPLDGVLVESINADHCKLAKAFVEQGVPAYVEKPLSFDYEEAKDLLDTAVSNDCPILSCSPLRFSPVFQEIARSVREGRLGLPTLAHARVIHTMHHFATDPRKRWHDSLSLGGGMVVDIGVHAVELGYMMLGPGAASVYCETSRVKYKDIESEDTAAITIKFADGAIAVCDVVCATNELEYSVMVNGSEDSIDSRELCAKLCNEGYGTPDGIGNALSAYGGFVETMRQFLKCIDRRCFPVPPLEMGEIVKILSAARASAKQHSPVLI
jgi:predicted dehydrogenase